MIIIVTILLLGICFSKKEEELIIPKEAIRFRIIPNSNLEEDQLLKQKVKGGVQIELVDLLKDAASVEEVREKVQEKIKPIENIVSNTLLENNSTQDFNVNYGLNYFPEKQYRGVTYQEGYYESLVVTLGEGNGDNWWCVLFPPLCLLEGEETETDEVEYTSFVKELLDRFWG